MKRFRSASLAAASAILIASVTGAARPQYGGTLRMQTQGTLRSVDPSATSTTALEGPTRRSLLPLVFETLIEVDPSGGLRPLLADSWVTEATGARWRVRLRPGVKAHDGMILTPDQVASSLMASRPDWQVIVDDGAIVITPPMPDPGLPWDLTELRTAITVRTGGAISGTGPFRVERLEASRLTLRAHEDHRDGRPFLDDVQIELGRPLAAQLSDLEVGRADLVDLGPGDTARVTDRQLRVVASRPMEVFALVFEAHRATPSSEPLRRTLAAAIDRAAIARVLLQGRAEPANALLPGWLSGYPSFASVNRPPELSRGAVAALPQAQRSLAIRVVAGDSVAQAIAQRVAVDARERGFLVTVQVPAGLGPRTDVRLIRLPLEPSAPDRTLAALFDTLTPRTLGLITTEPRPARGSPLDTVLRVERALLANSVLVPLVHAPALYGVGVRVDFRNGPLVLPAGALDLANVWIGPDRTGR